MIPGKPVQQEDKEFKSYTPGLYASKNIRITATRLADGREFFYIDDDPAYVEGSKKRELHDPRPLNHIPMNDDSSGSSVNFAAPKMRRDPLTGEWVIMATARMDRPITSNADSSHTGNPLAARDPSSSYQDGEIPDTDYDVVVFENRFPSMRLQTDTVQSCSYVNGNAMWQEEQAVGRCEVVCFDSNEHVFPANLPVSRLRTVVEAWAFRTAELSSIPGIKQVFPFENHGKEIGVTLAHPHGQIYAYPFIPAKMESEIQQAQAYYEQTGGNLLKDILIAELQAGERIIMRNHSWVAYVPAAARWPLEVHVAPIRDSILSLDQLNDQERWDLADLYSHLLKRGNTFFDAGDGQALDLPYIAAWYQAPLSDKRRNNYRLHLKFFSTRRSAHKMKYLAASESAMGAWISDTTPEAIAARFRAIGPVNLS